jgi:hypothetical protein
MYARYQSKLFGRVSKWIQPKTSEKVMAMAMMQPHEQHVRAPAKFAALKDEEIQTEIGRYSYKLFLNILNQVSRSQENLPTSLPIKRGRRPLQPH